MIQPWFNLTDEEMDDIMAHIEANREEVEAEYRQVVEEAERVRRYWTEYNREHMAKVAAMGPPPGKEEVWAKLQAWKAKLRRERELRRANQSIT